MFTHSAFIEYTPEMREWLESLGYEKGYHVNELNRYLYSYVAVNGKAYYCTCRICDFSTNYTDCTGNHQLFKAITALRDDSDYMQWFVNTHDKNFVICNSKKTAKEFFGEGWQYIFRKATIDELINHFKTEER